MQSTKLIAVALTSTDDSHGASSKSWRWWEVLIVAILGFAGCGLYRSWEGSVEFNGPTTINVQIGDVFGKDFDRGKRVADHESSGPTSDPP